MSTFSTFSNNDLDNLDLPVPEEDAIKHSQKVCARIKQEIAEHGGQIGFRRFMELVLYEPGLGYYSSGPIKLGESGDFITAPELSTVYSYCIAKQCQQVLNELTKCQILELGPGTGKMACDILLALEKQDCLPEKYLLLETSADLRERQQAYVKQHVPHLESIICWLETFPENTFSGIILANEVLDAMPVHRFVIGDDKILELNVAYDNNNFIWVRKPFDEDIRQTVDNELKPLAGTWPNGYTSELNIDIQSFINSLSDLFHQGVMLFIDYGYTRQDFYHPQRINGTLLCHYRHRVHNDPFVYLGLQDITSSVNFTSVAEAAVNAGLDIGGYTTQAHFLISCGLEDVLKQQEGALQRDSVELSAQIRQLTMPGEMGERFKVIALTKNLNIPLLGFQFVDHKAKL